MIYRFKRARTPPGGGPLRPSDEGLKERFWRTEPGGSFGEAPADATRRPEPSARAGSHSDDPSDVPKATTRGSSEALAPFPGLSALCAALLKGPSQWGPFLEESWARPRPGTGKKSGEDLQRGEKILGDPPSLHLHNRRRARQLGSES